MWSLRLIARIQPEKRLEFMQSVQALLRGDRERFRVTRVLQDVDDRSLFCWMADGEATEGLTTFLASTTFHALKGAAEVLGTVEELDVFESEGRLETDKDKR